MLTAVEIIEQLQTVASEFEDVQLPLSPNLPSVKVTVNERLAAILSSNSTSNNTLCFLPYRRAELITSC